MNKVISVLLLMLVTACGKVTVPVEQIEKVLQVCDKNGGVHSVYIIGSNVPKHALSRIYCNDGAEFDSHDIVRKDNSGEK